MSNYGRKNISEVTIVKALKMVEDGYSYSLVAEEVGCNKSLIGKWVKKAGIKPNTKIAKTYDRQVTHVKQDWSKVTDLQSLLAQAIKQEHSRVVEIIDKLKFSPKGCSEAYWNTRGDRVLKSQVYWEAMKDLLEALKELRKEI